MSDPTISVLFAGGPDDQTDPHVLPPGSVVAALNQIYDQDGSYQPRYGYTQLGGAELKTVRRLAVFADELLAIDGQRAFTYDPQETRWSLKDVAPAPGCTHRPLFNTTTNFTSWDETVAAGYRVVAWVDTVDSSPLVRAAVYSLETGAMVRGPEVLSSAGRSTHGVRVVSIGHYALVAWVDEVNPDVLACTIDLTNVQTSGFAAHVIISDPAHHPYVGGITTRAGYAICVTATTIILIYEKAPSGSQGQLVAISYVFTPALGPPTLTLQLQTSTTLAAHYYEIQALDIVAVDGGQLWLVASACGFVADSAAGIPAAWLLYWTTNTLVCGNPIFPIDTTVGTSSLNLCNFVSIDLTANVGEAVFHLDGPVESYGWVTSSGLIGTLQSIANVRAASSLVYSSEFATAFIVLVRPTLGTQGGTYFLVSLGKSGSPARDLQAILAPRIVDAPVQRSGAWSYTARLRFSDSATMEVLLPVLRSTSRQGMDLFRFDTLAPFRWSPASLGPESYLSGQVYDGNQLAEIGFAWNPHVGVVTGAGSGSFTGTWEYVVTYGRINAKGDLEESAPSDPVKVTVTSKAQFNIPVDTLTLTQKQRTSWGTAATATSPVFIIVYRTQAIASGDTLHYRVFLEPFPAANANDTTTDTVTIVDTTTDASLTDGTHPTLYTDSGELAHNCPETFTSIVAHKNRLWGIAADQRTVWYSQTYVEGVTPSFHEFQTYTVDDTDEPLLALASLYDKQLVYTATRVYVVYGDGPSISGMGNDLTSPQRVTSTGGCIDPRSIVNTPMGIMFQSIMGLMLIDPGLNVSFLGRNISNTVAASPICSSAQWCEDSSTVRFTLLTGEANSGTTNPATGAVVLYDVRRQRWAVHSLTRGASLTDAVAAPVQSAAWHPVLGYVEGHNTVFGGSAECLVGRESTALDATPWLDWGTYFVSLQVQMAPMRMQDLQGAQRVRRVRSLGRHYDAHTLTFQLAYDYGINSETHTYTSAQVEALIVGDREQIRIIPHFGKCEALGVTVSTSAPTSPQVLGTGRGAGFTGLSFEVHARKGGHRNIGAGAKS